MEPTGELQYKYSPGLIMIREVGFGDERLTFSHTTMTPLLVGRVFTKLPMNLL